MKNKISVLKLMHGFLVFFTGRQGLLRMSAIMVLVCGVTFFTSGQSQITNLATIKKNDLTTRIWLGSQLLPGYGQIYNRQYWKIPVFYAGMGSMAYFGYHKNSDFKRYQRIYQQLPTYDPVRESIKIKAEENRQQRNLFYAAATAFYLASVSDAILVYNRSNHSPAAATILSTLVPGMGQAYNGAYWKIPVIYGGLSTLYFMTDWNNRGYDRFKTALISLIDGDPNTIDEFNGTRTEDELRYYMDSYRRNRDLSILGLAAVYVLNIIDANVDGYLYDWNVDDNLAFKVEPSVFNTNLDYTQVTPAFGFTCRVTF